MISGYVDESENVFCADCWKMTKAIGGAARLLRWLQPPYFAADRFI